MEMCMRGHKNVCMSSQSLKKLVVEISQVSRRTLRTTFACHRKLSVGDLEKL